MRVISASLSPNTEKDDVILALKTLFSPWKWKEGKEQREIGKWFKDYFQQEPIFFNSGRSAFLAILKAFNIGKGDEVLIQAFTCVAVPNSVLWSGAVPVYVDIDNTLNMDPEDAQKKVTKKTKALIIQHTFGVPAQVDKLLAIAKKHKLIVIEDCAHLLGATYKGQKVGTVGDAAFFSFGRDKVVSSVWGGMTISNNKYKISNIKKYQKSLFYPSFFWILQQLLHPIVFSVILPLYDVGIGKILLVLLQKLLLLSFPVYPEEKRGRQPKDFPARYPNALAVLLLNQLRKLERYNRQRVEIVKLYCEYFKSQQNITATLRYPIFVPDPSEIIKKAKSQNILLGNWYHKVIDPAGVDYTAVGYILGSCPKAEKAAQYIVNLPTRISREEAKRVLDCVK